MKPTGYVEAKSSEVLPRLKGMYDYVKETKFHEFALEVNYALETPIGMLWWKRKRTLTEAWDWVIENDYGYLLEKNQQMNDIEGLIKACALSETVLINTDQLRFVLTLE